MFEEIKLDWQKRRKPDSKKIVVDFKVKGFKKEHNHFCKLNVSYHNGETKELIARVIYSELSDMWVVDGMHFAVRLIEE